MPTEINPFQLRHYNPESDLTRLSGLLGEIEAVDRDGEDTSETGLRRMLEWPNYHPQQDAWVLEVDGKLQGYAMALAQPAQRCTIYVAVHPDLRRTGFGKMLLGAVLQRAKEMDAKNVLVYANGHNLAANTFVTRHGFVLVGCSGVMRTAAGTIFPPFEIPIGFQVKRYSEINDLTVLAIALNECYLGMWGHQHEEHAGSQEDSIAARFLKEFGAEGIHLLFDAHNTIAGLCSASSNARTGKDGQPADLLDAPGIIKPYRQAGYQRALALAALGWLRKQADRPVTLEFWGDDEKTLATYAEIGFEPDQKFNAYNRELQ